jgi:hypothetical protein
MLNQLLQRVGGQVVLLLPVQPPGLLSPGQLQLLQQVPELALDALEQVRVRGHPREQGRVDHLQQRAVRLRPHRQREKRTLLVVLDQNPRRPRVELLAIEFQQVHEPDLLQSDLALNYIRRHQQQQGQRAQSPLVGSVQLSFEQEHFQHQGERMHLWEPVQQLGG